MNIANFFENRLFHRIPLVAASHPLSVVNSVMKVCKWLGTYRSLKFCFNMWIEATRVEDGFSIG